MFNYRGFVTLFNKEVLRFVKVFTQTVAAPSVTTLLYLAVFGQVLEDHVQVYDGVSYLSFLVPGLVMMTVIQNAFANSSSSIIQSKMNGNIVFMLLAPLSPLEICLAFIGAAVVRGLMVGVVVYLVALPFVSLPVAHPLLVLALGALGSAVLGALGLIAGIWAEKYDQLAAFQNFIILPLSFLSGVFYSLHSLPPLWQGVSRFNPFFYMIDGFRYGFFGVGDVSPWLSLAVSAACLSLVGGLCLVLLHKGYKIRG